MINLPNSVGALQNNFFKKTPKQVSSSGLKYRRGEQGMCWMGGQLRRHQVECPALKHSLCCIAFAIPFALFNS